MVFRFELVCSHRFQKDLVQTLLHHNLSPNISRTSLSSSRGCTAFLCFCGGWDSTYTRRVVSLLACRSPPVIRFNRHQHRRISREGASRLMKLPCIAQLNLRHVTSAAVLCPVFMLSPTLVSDLFSDRSETVSDLFCAQSEANLRPPKVIAKPAPETPRAALTE